MQNFLIIGNWKENTTLKETIAWFQKASSDLKKIKKTEVVICPSFISLPAMKTLSEETSLKIGAQNLSALEKGAYTGEVSASMLVGLAEYVIIGHSERRRYFGEDNNTTAQKTKVALKHNIRPIVCVSDKVNNYGIPTPDEEYNEENFLKQATYVLKDLPPEDQNKLVFGYEPPSAISKQINSKGVGQAAPVDEVEEMVKKIKTVAPENKIIYGGSVKSDNILDFFDKDSIDGVLVGSASLDPEEFLKLVLKVEEKLS